HTSGLLERLRITSVGTTGLDTPQTTTSVALVGPLEIQSMTPGSVPFIGTGGVLTQDNANFGWYPSTHSVHVGPGLPLAWTLLAVNATRGPNLVDDGTNTVTPFINIVAAGSPEIVTQKFGGTFVSPNITDSGDTLFQLSVWGTDFLDEVHGPDGELAARFRVTQDGNVVPDTCAVPGQMSCQTT